MPAARWCFRVSETWRPSPMAGAERYMLDRFGREVARETSIVRYAAGARFSAPTHGGGEEFLVLAGSFHDDSGDYPERHIRAQPDRSSASIMSRTRGCDAVRQAAPVRRGAMPSAW